jgi:hypothetical protein
MKKENRKVRRFRWLLAMLGVFLALAAIVWFGVGGYVKSRIQDQLSDLELGDSVIRSVSISGGGVSATGIEFYRPGDKEPWLKLDELKIKHPISALISGASTFNEIELNSVQAIVDLPEIGDADMPLSFDLSELDLPAKKIDVNRANIVLRQPGRSDLIAGDVNLSITSETTDSQQVKISGNIGSLLGGQFAIKGSATPNKNSFTVKLASEKIKLENGRWQSLPYLPANLETLLEADGETSLELEINSSSEGAPQFAAAADIQKLALDFPALNFDLALSAGTANFRDNKITFSKVAGTTDGEDHFSLQGATSVASFPIATKFSGKYDDVAISSLRNLVPVIPEMLSGKNTGEFSGSVKFASDTRTTIDIATSAQGKRFKYGSIDADNLTAEVEIDDLIFDAKQKFESIGGFVKAAGCASRQDITNVFDTFQLQDLNRQLEITGNGQGTFELDLPLATADQLETWQLKIDAQMPVGTISQQQVANVKLDAAMIDAEIRFAAFEATPVFENGPATESDTEVDPQLKMQLVWPLLDEGNDTGTLTIEGLAVQPIWLSRFLERQLQLSMADQPATKADVGLPTGDMAGRVNFDVKIGIPAATPDDLSKWIVGGNLQDSVVAIGSQKLQELQGKFGLSAGNFSVSDLDGNFDSGGVVSGGGHLSLIEPNVFLLKLETTDSPASWLLGLANEFSTKFVAGNDFLPEKLRSIAGNVAISVELGSNNQTDLVETKIDGPNWFLKTQVASNEIALDGRSISALDVKAFASSSEIRIESFRGTLADDGSVSGSGNWQIETESGRGDLEWNRLPINWITAISGLSVGGIRGTTKGRIEFTSIQPLDPNGQSIPVEVQGTIGTRGFSVGSFRAKPFQFDIKTRTGLVQLENFRVDDILQAIAITGQASLTAPYKFQMSGDLGRSQLSRLFRRSSVVDREGRTTDVAGLLSGDFGVQGQLEDFNWRSSGDVQVDSATVNKTKLGDLDVQWNYPGNDGKTSKLKVDAFGGSIEMVELTSQPERVRVEIKDIDAFLLNSLVDLPIEFSGKVSGDASLHDWSVTETKWADLKLQGSSILLGETEFGDFTANVEYRKQELSYEVNGTLLGGKLVGKGQTQVNEANSEKTTFPFDVVISNAALRRLNAQSNYFRSIREIDGNLSAQISLELGAGQPLAASGRVGVRDLKWQNELLTRDVSIRFALDDNGSIVFDDVRADLNRGSISARAIVPFFSSVAGSYQVDVRQMDLARIMEIVAGDADGTQGLFNARLSGQIGRQAISGSGFVGVDQVKLHGVTGQSMKIPIQYTFRPLSQSGRIDLRQASFRLFDGNVSGKGEIEFGRRLGLDMDFKLVNVDAGKMLTAVADMDGANQGTLSGRLTLKGRSIRSPRDLKGSFVGKLESAAAFELPVLNGLSRFIASGNVSGRDFDSDVIDLRLSKGRIEVKSLSFQNSLAKIAITGDAFLDGRLGLSVAARVESVNQPTLIDEIAGSPLAQLTGSPVSFFAQAADFVSDRVVFLKVGGTFSRPQVKIETGQQLREETVRYFLRGSQILPYQPTGNN